MAHKHSGAVGQDWQVVSGRSLVLFMRGALLRQHKVLEALATSGFVRNGHQLQMKAGKLRARMEGRRAGLLNPHTYIIDGGNTQVLLLGLVKLRFEKCGLRNKSGVILMKVPRHNETDQMLGCILDLEGDRCQCIDGKLASLGHALVGIVGGKVLVTVLRELLEVDAAL